MSNYDSLAEQMQEDYKSIMVAFTVMNKQMRRFRKSIRSMHKTVMTVLAVQRTHSGRLDDLERRVGSLETRPPAA